MVIGHFCRFDEASSPPAAITFRTTGLSDNSAVRHSPNRQLPATDLPLRATSEKLWTWEIFQPRHHGEFVPLPECSVGIRRILKRTNQQPHSPVSLARFFARCSSGSGTSSASIFR